LTGLLVTPAQEVKAGDVLAVFASRTLRELELQAANTQLAEAESRREAEQALADARIEQAKVALKRAEAAKQEVALLGEKLGYAAASSEIAKKVRAKLVSLPDDLVSEQRRDEEMLRVERAKLELAAAEAEHRQAQQESELNIAAAEAELAAAQAARAQVLAAVPVETLQLSRQLAERQLERTQLVAPVDATVLGVFARAGEAVGQTPVVQLANLKQMVVVAEVYETDVKQLKVGQKATVNSRAFRSPYDEQGLRGTVEQIGRMISSPALKSLDPFAQADRRVIEVRILLDPEDARQAAEFVGLQVDVTFSNE
jgi:HlyD family secretion protein